MTDEQFSNGALDRWLRQHAANPDANPAPDGWDLPSERVWEQVRAGMPRRKRRLIWLWLLAGLAGCWVLAIGLYRSGRVGAGDMVVGKSVQPASTSIPVDSTTEVGPHRGGAAAGAASTNNSSKPGRSNDFASKTLTINKNKPVEDTQKIAAPFISAPSIATEKADIEESEGPAPNPEQPAEAVPPAFAAPPMVPRIQPNVHFSSPSNTPSTIKVKPTPPRQWYAGLYAARLFSSRVLKKDESNGRPNGLESGAWTFQYGLTAGRQVGRHWFLETGLQRSSIRIDALRRGSFRFRSDQERYNAQRQMFESSAREGLETSFGAVEMRFDLIRGPHQPIADQTEVFYALQTEEAVHYIRIPLTIGYRGQFRRWQWGAAAGPGLNLRSGYDFRVVEARTENPGLRATTVQAERQAAGLATGLIDLQADLRIGYRFSPHWTIRLSPEGRYGLGSMYRNGPFRSLPVSGGVALGLNWAW